MCRVRSTTRYPVDGDLTLALEMASPMRFPLSVRVPSWSKAITVTAGGRE